jgi:hypothetical protein
MHNTYVRWNHSSIVSVATDHELNDQGLQVLVPVG